MSQSPKVLLALVSIAACYLTLTFIRAAHKPLWYDEIATVMVSQGNLAQVWKVETTGADYNPPLSYLLTKLAARFIQPEEFFARFPSIAGYLLMMACLCVFISRRLGLAFVFPAVIFVLLSRSYDYAYEARPYGLVLACAGIALISWQAAAEDNASKPIRRFGLAGLTLALATALLLHCYAVVLYIPMGVGEIWRTWSRKRIDFPMWIALAISMLPLSIYPFMFAASREVTFGGTLFPRVRGLAGVYAFLLRPALLPFAILLVPVGFSPTGTGLL